MRTILLIDDDEMLLEALRTLLSDQGYAVRSTADGPQGIELYKALHPNIVLLDLALPTMSGIEVLKEIRRYDANARIIVITGYGSVETAVLTLREGALDFFEKGTDVNILLRKIETALGGPEEMNS